MVVIRVWDIHPGYLSRTRLLGEHREIHAVWTVITEDKKGYSKHPETERWRGHLTGLYRRHQLVVSEMTLRGYKHKSPISELKVQESKEALLLLDNYPQQFIILDDKYAVGEQGRMPLPKRGYDFWAHHKYSVMARGYEEYKEVSEKSTQLGRVRVEQAQEIMCLVYSILQVAQTIPALKNTWQHIVGYFKKLPNEIRIEWMRQIPEELKNVRFAVYQQAQELDLEYIEHSTVLADPIIGFNDDHGKSKFRRSL